ncbi:MAG: hypothetical protein C7B46_02915, partial [Sulfobacillus benefaciens]
MGKKSKSRKNKTGKNHSISSPPKSSSVVPSSHYAVLGIQADADYDIIRQQYLSLVRQFPPETHPDVFQKIRAAYDVLKDPESRRQYDRERFYGGSLDDLKKKASDLISYGRGQEAIQVLHQIVDIRPSVEDYMLLMEGYVDYGNIKSAEEYYQKAVALVDDVGEKVKIGIQWTYAVSHYHDIIDSLMAIADQYPEVAPAMVASELFVHYLNAGQIKKGMAYYRSLISRKKYPTASDFAVYIDWLNVLEENQCYFEFNHLLETKVKPAAQKAAQGPHRDAIKDRLLKSIAVETDLPQWKLKTIITNLVCILDPTDENARKLWREYAAKYLLLSQMDEMIMDLRIPNHLVELTLVSIREKYQVSYGEQFWQSFQSRPHTEETLTEPAALELMSQSYSRVYHVVQQR